MKRSFNKDFLYVFLDVVHRNWKLKKIGQICGIQCASFATVIPRKYMDFLSDQIQRA